MYCINIKMPIIAKTVKITGFISNVFETMDIYQKGVGLLNLNFDGAFMAPLFQDSRRIWCSIVFPHMTNHGGC